MKKYTYERVEIDALTATDLLQEAKECADAQAYRISIEGAAESADALFIPGIYRLGIAQGADATWADVEGVEEGIEMWLNEPEEWAQRN